MALAFGAHLGTQRSSSDATSYNFTVSTPTSGRVCLLAVEGRRLNTMADPSSISGLGLTWSKIVGISDAADRQNLSIWKGTGTPSGTTLTVNWPSTESNCSISLSEWVDLDPTTPFVQTKSAQATNGTSSSVTLDSTPTSGWVYSATAIQDTATPTQTKDTDWTLIGEANGSNLLTGLLSQYRNANDTNATTSWTGSTGDYISFIGELRAVASGSFLDASATCAATSTVAAAAVRAMPISATAAGAATASASAGLVSPTAATSAAVGSASATAILVLDTSATAAGVAGVTTAAVTLTDTAATVAASSTVAASAVLDLNASATVTAASTVTATPEGDVVYLDASAAVAAVSSTSVTAAMAMATSATVAGAGVASASAVLDLNGAATVTAASSVAAAAIALLAAQASVTGVSSVVATPTALLVASATLAAAVAVTAAAVIIGEEIDLVPQRATSRTHSRGGAMTAARASSRTHTRGRQP